jgi:hypothetical protein
MGIVDAKGKTATPRFWNHVRARLARATAGMTQIVASRHRGRGVSP